MNLFGYHEEDNIFDRGGFDMDGFEDFADSSVQESTGRWTREEHLAFVKGLELYGKGWKKIASLIKTRTVVQIRTHAQKYFLKLTKSRQNVESAGISIDGKPLGQRKKNKRGKERPVALAPSIVPFVRSRSHLALTSSSSMAADNTSTAPVDISEADIIDIDDGLYNFLSPQLFPVLTQSNIDKHTAITQNRRKNTSAYTNSLHTGSEGLGDVSDNICTIPSFDAVDETNKRSSNLSPTNIDLSGVLMYAEKPDWFLRGHNVDVLLKDAEDLNWLSDCGTELTIEAILNGTGSSRNSYVSNSKNITKTESTKSHDIKVENASDVGLPAFDTNDLLSHFDPVSSGLDIESMSSAVTDTDSGTDNNTDMAEFWINLAGKSLAGETRNIRKVDSNVCLSEFSGSTDESHSTETERVTSPKRERESARNTKRKKTAA